MTRAWMILVFSLSSAACGDRAAETVCYYGGASYQTGQTFLAGDGCNTCTCNAEGQLGVRCSGRRCDGSPMPAGSCTYNGKLYKPGEQFPATDGCNSCICGADGTDHVGCTMRRCIDGGIESCPTVSAPAGAGYDLNGKACSVSSQIQCRYLIEDCIDYSDVEWLCTCMKGAWNCSRGYDCPRHWAPDGGAPPPSP